MRYAWSLKNRLADELRAQKILSYEQVVDLVASTLNPKTGEAYKLATAERRTRLEADYLPVIKLNAKMKPIKGSERWYFVKWDGGSTKFKKYA